MILNLLNPILTGVASAAMSDEEAVRLYMESHNVNYFNLIYDRYSDKIFAKCISILKIQEDAEDAVQDIFVKVLLNLAGFNGKSRFSTWIYAITYNYCIDLARRKSKNITDSYGDMHIHADLEDPIDDSKILEVKIQKLKMILNDLSPEDKSVLLMKYQDDMSIRDICTVFNKTESAVKMKILRAKERFIKVYEQNYMNGD
ncbi:MAG: sigma-70 family RNA polymerase sigma factor [Saprospiraceae bacterium]|nr:sigma-70 family RNA polymerase sigma factor [Saprospiraceae bacterium]